jgi:hypothetical protein
VNEGELEEYLGDVRDGPRAGHALAACAIPCSSSRATTTGRLGATAPPDGTARKNWWRHFGWPFLRHRRRATLPLAGLHVRLRPARTSIGLEAYINNGSYDHYLQDIWGAQSFTRNRWPGCRPTSARSRGARRSSRSTHYDFGGTLGERPPGANFSQINPRRSGLDARDLGPQPRRRRGQPRRAPDQPRAPLGHRPSASSASSA